MHIYVLKDCLYAWHSRSKSSNVYEINSFILMNSFGVKCFEETDISSEINISAKIDIIKC